MLDEENYSTYLYLLCIGVRFGCAFALVGYMPGRDTAQSLGFQQGVTFVILFVCCINEYIVPQKGKTTYEVWSFEVKCLQKAKYIPDHVILQSIHNSLKGSVRAMLVPLGENATIEDILSKLDGFYGNVAAGETLNQSFYNDSQKENESIVTY